MKIGNKLISIQFDYIFFFDYSFSIETKKNPQVISEMDKIVLEIIILQGFHTNSSLRIMIGDGDLVDRRGIVSVLYQMAIELPILTIEIKTRDESKKKWIKTRIESKRNGRRHAMDRKGRRGKWQQTSTEIQRKWIECMDSIQSKWKVKYNQSIRDI